MQDEDENDDDDYLPISDSELSAYLAPTDGEDDDEDEDDEVGEVDEEEGLEDRPSSVPLPPVVYEDDELLAFDKPSGLLVAPDHWNKDLDYLMRLVHQHWSPAVANAHRLDRDTSGVLLCAKTLDATRRLREAFDEHRVAKTYLALTRSAPREDRQLVSVPIGYDPRRGGRMRIDPYGGKPAETDVEVLERFAGGRFAYVRAMPRSGRTHQVRIHLAHLGCPIVADGLYGGGGGLLLSEIKSNYKRKPGVPERPLIDRLALHAQSLTVDHSTTGQPVTIAADLPADFALALKLLRRHGRWPVASSR
jgi:RluA family pseudouridine synthase